MLLHWLLAIVFQVRSRDLFFDSSHMEIILNRLFRNSLMVAQGTALRRADDELL